MYRNIRRKADGTFIVDFNGLPFHVTPDYPAAEQYGEEMTYGAISAYAEANPLEVADYEEPVLPEPSAEEIRRAEITALESRANELSLRIQAELSEQDVTDSKGELREIMIELENLKSREA